MKKGFKKIILMTIYVIGIVCGKTFDANCQNPVFLPFIDDFSSYTGQADTRLWQKGNVLINSGFQFLPPTVGVATLDILDSEGRIYEQASVYGFVADTLCSRSIRLDSIKEPVNKRLFLSDSIYLSFFIQPGGSMGALWERIGSAPSTKDSIIVQFYKSNQNSWHTVWSMQGVSLDSIYKRDSVYFLQVLIPLTDTAYFNKDFRFRFINYGSLDNNPSYDYIFNKGQWNIDYVYMDINRNYKDSTIRDIAFVNPAMSLLKNFTSIPAKHFKKEYMKDRLDMKIINLYSSTLNSAYSYNIKDENNTTLHSYNGGFENIVSYPKTHNFQTAQNHIEPKVDYVFNPPQNKFSSYTITHIVSEGVGQDFVATNDTIRCMQKFENYFSYDDGTAESGIGIEPSKSSLFAIGYPLLVTDTLYAVDIYFNSSWQESNLNPFYLYIYDATENITIYKDEYGKEISDTTIIPNQMLYESTRLAPQYDSLNKFNRYYLDEPLVLPPGMFFVALKSASSTYLNIGFDQNNDASPFTFEKQGKDWINVFLKGATMIRPYFGYASVGLESVEEKLGDINIYPNPAKDEIILTLENCATNKDLDVIIFDILGNIVYFSDYSDYHKDTSLKKINVKHLQNGMYILKVGSLTKKLIIAR